MKEQIESAFTYHAPSDSQAAKYVVIRSSAELLASTFDELCPDSREKSLAMTKLEEAFMWASKSIAVNE